MDKSIGDMKTMGGAPEHGGYTLSSGDTLGQYRVIRALGRGGMGEVYLCEHAILTTKHAVKLLPQDFSERAGAIERFKREARVMAQLQHPHIVKVDEFGETDGRYWLRMECANGVDYGDSRVTSLQDLAEAGKGRIGQETLAGILRQVLKALGHAHRQGVVHRDLKPSNILIFTDTPGSSFKIADFGLVRLVGEDWVRSQAQLTIQRSMSMGELRTMAGAGSSAGSSTRSMLGTFEYMSPEQKRGEDATAASDLYAVGLMAFKLLTGRSLGMKTPTQIDSRLARGWDVFVGKALEDEPAERLGSAEEALTLLDGIDADITGNGGSGVVPKSVASRPEPMPVPRQPLPVTREPSIPRSATPPPRPRKGTAHLTKKKRGARLFWGLLLLVAMVAGGVWIIRDEPDRPIPPVVPPRADPPTTRPGVTSPAVQEPAPAPRTPSTARGGPVAGENWTSPTTGMEFVWIRQMNMWVGKHEVTNGEYRRKEPGHDSRSYEGRSLNGDRQPVVYVNYDDGKAYAAWLTERDRAAGRLPDGLRYRLPTGDEWMTFAQCGDGREYPWGNNWPPRSGQAGNYRDAAAQREVKLSSPISGYTDGHAVTAPVDALWENPWGLKGVGGNVWEMTSKTAGGDFDAWRGAAWSDLTQGRLRCAYRFDLGGSNRDHYGFRLVLVR